MLHILWMILKIILIVIGILLGLLVLALLLLLFCPVRYRAQASGNIKEYKKAQASVTVSWLFSGVLVRLWLKDGKAAHSIRLFGIPLEKLLNLLRRGKKGGKKASHASKAAGDERKEKKAPAGSRGAGKPEDELSPGSAGAKKPEDEASVGSGGVEKSEDEAPAGSAGTEKTEDEAFPGSAGAETSGDGVIPQTEELPKIRDTSQTEEPEKTAVSEKGPGSDAGDETADAGKTGFFERIRNIISGFLDKLKKIPETVRSFTSKLHSIYDKIDYWKQFLSHPRVKDALSFAWQHVKAVLKHVFPTRLEGHVTFGSEDPSVTGAVLAVLGMTMGFHKNRIEAEPVFGGENLLYGDVKLRGRIYGFVIVKAAVQVYFNKNIKYVINRWKHKEESL